MPNGRCKVHGGKSTGPRTPEGLERSKRARWEARLLLSRSEGGTVARAGRNACAPLSAHVGSIGFSEDLRSRAMLSFLAGFRTIQVCPKDLRALPVHPEPTVSWHSGFRGGAHARPKTTRVHHAHRRRGRVAARGARAATSRARSGASTMRTKSLTPEQMEARVARFNTLQTYQS